MERLKIMKSIYFIEHEVINYYGVGVLKSKHSRLLMSQYAITDGKLIKSRDLNADNQKLSAKQIVKMIDEFDGIVYSVREPVRIENL